MKTLILTTLAMILTVSVSSADILDDMFSKQFVTETTEVLRSAAPGEFGPGVRFGITTDFEENFNEFLKTTNFVFFKKWATTKPGTRCCAIWNASKVYALCISGILLTAGEISH